MFEQIVQLMPERYNDLKSLFNKNDEY